MVEFVINPRIAQPLKRRPSFEGRLATEHRMDREAYTDAKSAYVERVMREPCKGFCMCF
jgi:hypothetical protein